MFSFFKRKPPEKNDEPHPRGMLPTYLNGHSVILCKASSTVRDTYEIRLGLYMASTRNSRFVLTVRPDTNVDANLKAFIEECGGGVEVEELPTYSVYIGHIKSSGEQGDGWVLGDAAAFAKFRKSLRSDWCRQMFVLDATLAGGNLVILEGELEAEKTSQTNIDDENIRDALLALVHAAKTEGGTIFIQ